MWAGSLASIRGKTWPWLAGHFATLEVSTCQMPRYVPAGEGGGVRGFTLTGALLKMTDWRLAPSALILAPLGLTKTSQFSLRRGWNVSYFNLTCSNGPGSCHSAATLDTELTWSTWKTSKKYRHWKTASFLNSTRNIKVFKPFYGSLSTFSIVRFPFKGWTWIRTKSETFQRTSTSIDSAMFAFGSQFG